MSRDPEDAPPAAIGFSLGANLLLKYLGGSRLYRRHLLGKLKASLRRKFAHRPFPLDVDLDAIHDFNQFDDQITAPLNGFAGVFDYYTRASCRPFLAGIHTPTLILQAADDPFMFPTTVPWAHELGPGVALELAAHGGHVGFVAGVWPWRPHYWLETHVLEYLHSDA